MTKNLSEISFTPCFAKKRSALVYREKAVLALIILLCFAGPLSAQEYAPDSGFMGIGPGVNGDARRGPSYGGIFALGINFNNQFSTGVKTSFFDNFKTVSAHETLLFFRHYFLSKNSEGPFAQLEGGSVIFFERGYHQYLEAFPVFSGGLSVGWHFNLGEHWYLEPAARTGYPHIWGASITTGIRFKSKGKVAKDDNIAVQDNNFALEDDLDQTENKTVQIENNDETAEIKIEPIRSNVDQTEGVYVRKINVH